MSGVRQVRPVWWGLLAIALLALSGSFSWRTLRRELDLWRRQRTQSATMTETSRNWVTDQLALHDHVGRTAPDPGELVAVYLPGSTAAVTEGDADPLPLGYRMRQATVTVQDVSWENVSRFMEKIESQRPPWRVSRVELVSGVGGLGGTLTLEALDKTSIAP